ncbi:uncharacterized protein LOC111707324 [Eurytemora carolleeae]|uniref:uncharacterized protein LOC111707324 n=1 Tax=Eurytemora carolleeae TaxID=1294199 RepID=UPI000C7599C2|nr:uncharacterized protein LOC111707324 [Eurytemora carolleeae]|eukprot:XP_023336173.1 uncharacterized protein LOC111707324 [Eurytemora affinis]
MRLLINLVCNQEMIPPLLSTPSPSLSFLLNPTTPEEELLRSSTLLANICVTSSRLNLSHPATEGFLMEPGTLQEQIFINQSSLILNQAVQLRDSWQGSTDIKFQASKIAAVLGGLHV